MSEITELLARVEEVTKKYDEPVVSRLKSKNSPFLILVSTLLSLRTKDEVTEVAQEKLFKLADSPEKLAELDVKIVEKTIYPVGFYKRKAANLIKVAKYLIEKHNGNVPDSLNELLKIPGVGRKTANLVLTEGYGLPGVCVDTHVHRIFNRWGYVETKNPDNTEMVLRKKLPPEWWMRVNNILVVFGQKICKPVSPHCSKCPINGDCPAIGVKYRR
jgi:endonuclease-3